jgi:hypothetical protein
LPKKSPQRALNREKQDERFKERRKELVLKFHQTLTFQVGEVISRLNYLFNFMYYTDDWGYYDFKLIQKRLESLSKIKNNADLYKKLLTIHHDLQKPLLYLHNRLWQISYIRHQHMLEFLVYFNFLIEAMRLPLSRMRSL